MLVYRVAHPKYARDISGYGSLLVPGRWNYKGHRVLYTAQNSSLALLEYLAHTEGLAKRLPYQLITLEIPEASVKTIQLSGMPNGWKEDTILTRELGSKWLDSYETLVLNVPSVINEDDSNCLINPNHEMFSKVRAVSFKEITYDKRLW